MSPCQVLSDECRNIVNLNIHKKTTPGGNPPGVVFFMKETSLHTPQLLKVKFTLFHA